MILQTDTAQIHSPSKPLFTSMAMKRIIVFVVSCLLLCSSSISASDTLMLDNRFGVNYILKKQDICIFKDSIGLSSSDVLLHGQALFSPVTSGDFSNEGGKFDYWIQINVKTEAQTMGYVLDVHSPNARRIDLYRVDENKEVFLCGSTGLDVPYAQRSYRYKNLVIDMDLKPSSVCTYYVHVRKGGYCRFDFFITPYHYFLYYGSTEYYILGMFYGLMAIMMIYKLMIYVSLKDKVYLAYVSLLVFAVLKALSEDRTGALYLWTDYPYLSYMMGVHIAPAFILVSYVFYVHAFLNLHYWKDLHSKWIIGSTLVHFLFYALVSWVWGDVIYSTSLIVLPYATVFTVVCIRFFNQKNLFSTYFLAASAWFLLIMVIDTLRHQRLVFGGSVLVFSFYFFMVVQSMLLALSIFQRFRILLHENKKLIVDQLEQERLHYGAILKEHYHTQFAQELKSYISLILSPLHQLGKKVSHPDILHVEAIKNLTHKIDLYADQLLEAHSMAISAKYKNTIEGDLVDFMKEISRSFDCLMVQKQLTILYTCNLNFFLCRFDVSRIEKIVFNVLSNAIKYSDNGESVRLDLFIDTTHSRFTLEVKDTGLGMSEDLCAKLAMAFRQKEMSSLPDIGIGLYFTKVLVDQLEGTIEIESELHKGSVFTVHIPYQSLEINDELYEEYSLLALPVQVLLVENNQLFGDYLMAALSAFYEVGRTVSKAETLAFLSQHRPEVVVLDFNFTESYGCDLLKSIKERYPLIKVLCISGSKNLALRSTLFQRKADAFLFKPFRIEDVKLCIDSLLEKKTSTESSLHALSLEEKSSEAVRSFAHRVEQIILKNIDNTELNVEILVKELGISRAQLYRKFSDFFGQSIKEYISTVRIRIAAELMQQETLSIKEVMARVGFNNRNYFIKCFKEYFKVLPSEYKKTLHS